MTTDFSQTSQPSGGNATLKSQKNEYQADQSSIARPDLNKQRNKIRLPRTNILQPPSRRNASSLNWVPKDCIRNPISRSKFHHENTQPILGTRGTHTQDCFLPVPLHLAISIQLVLYQSDSYQVVAKFSIGRRAQKLTPETILLAHVSASLLAVASWFVRVDATGSCGRA